MLNLKNNIELLLAKKNDKIIDIIEIINENELKHAFIVDDKKKLLGIVSDGDVRRALLKDIPLIDPVERIMNKNPFVAKVGISKTEILKILIDKHIQIIPILNDKRQVVSYYHIIDFIKKEFLINNINEPLDSRVPEKILITGGAGYIGSTLVRLLLNKGYFVRVLDRLMFGDDSIKELKYNPHFELIKGDYTRIEDLILSLKNISSVVHLAAIVGDPAGKIDPDLTIETNFHGVKIFAEFCKYYGIKRFIFISTCSVYGASGDNFLTEESTLNPISLYAETKLKAEKELLKLRDSSFHPCIIRLATVFGLSYRMRFDLVVNILTAYSVIRKEISIFSGRQWRPLIHVKDAGEAIINLLEQPLEKISGEIFNIGKDENNYRIEDLGNIMKKIFPGLKVNCNEDKEDNRSYRVSFNKAKNVIDFNAEYNVEDGVREIAEYLINNDINIQDRKYSNYKNVQYGIFDSIDFVE